MIDGARRFFLGGRDLEMVEIARLLEEHGESFEDRGLAWGACLSTYASAITSALAEGSRPVAVELADDMPADWPLRPAVAIVDHHSARAGAHVPTSLEQVATLIGVPSVIETRWRQLVSANDRGHIAGMKAIGATSVELHDVRAADRRAQGVSAIDERIAQTAIRSRSTDERLTIVWADLTSATAVSDFISRDLGGPGADRLLVIMPQKLAAYGDGAMIAALAGAVPSGWWGGDLPSSGFWGADRLQAGSLEPILDAIRKSAVTSS